MTTHTIAIIEDHPDFREQLRDALNGDGRMQVVGTCRDQSEGQRLIEQTCPDVLLVDLGLPNGGNGLTNIRHALQRWGGRCASAVLTVARNEEYLLDAVRAGAVGYVAKTDSETAWIEAVRLMAVGGSPLNAPIAHLMLRELPATEPKQREEMSLTIGSLLRYVSAGYTLEEFAQRTKVTLAETTKLARAAYLRVHTLALQTAKRLSPNEARLLTLFAQGLTAKQCAELLGVAESTVKTFTQRLYEKLGVNSRDGALLQARRQGLISDA